MPASTNANHVPSAQTVHTQYQAVQGTTDAGNDRAQNTTTQQHQATREMNPGHGNGPEGIAPLLYRMATSGQVQGGPLRRGQLAPGNSGHSGLPSGQGCAAPPSFTPSISVQAAPPFQHPSQMQQFQLQQAYLQQQAQQNIAWQWYNHQHLLAMQQRSMMEHSAQRALPSSTPGESHDHGAASGKGVSAEHHRGRPLVQNAAYHPYHSFPAGHLSHYNNGDQRVQGQAPLASVQSTAGYAATPSLFASQQLVHSAWAPRGSAHPQHSVPHHAHVPTMAPGSKGVSAAQYKRASGSTTTVASKPRPASARKAARKSSAGDSSTAAPKPKPQPADPPRAKRKRKSESIPGGDGATVPPSKVAFPKRPSSLFLIYCCMHRPRLRRENPDMTFSDMSKTLGQMWRNATRDEKSKVMATHAKQRERYEAEVRRLTLLRSHKDSDSNKTPSREQSRLLRKPKRPTTAYLYFTQRERPRVRFANPQMTFAEIGRTLGVMWQNLPEADRAPYTALYEQDRRRYEVEERAWKEKLCQNDT